MKSLMHDAQGAASVEYGLVLALIVLAILGAVVGLGGGVQASYQNTADKVAQVSK
ncbi:MAG: Flp family type IVb pilin [Novosphingobium sp.]|uniref:Flp family type IVb pilin n=1 Tax=Novosphingobium sp. TaxID=1874826 RepID=UPI002605EFBE|nr:Flp family type IVb pilin [Novosphingobium sp.]MCP5387831.1 Flp family type IVb pilin [Novosphingobium sp.]